MYVGNIYIVHACLCTGTSIIIVAVSAGVSHEQYGIGGRSALLTVQNNSMHTMVHMFSVRCWISNENGAIWGFIGPMLLIILVS